MVLSTVILCLSRQQSNKELMQMYSQEVSSRGRFRKVRWTVITYSLQNYKTAWNNKTEIKIILILVIVTANQKTTFLDHPVPTKSSLWYEMTPGTGLADVLCSRMAWHVVQFQSSIGVINPLHARCVPWDPHESHSIISQHLDASHNVRLYAVQYDGSASSEWTGPAHST